MTKVVEKEDVDFLANQIDDDAVLQVETLIGLPLGVVDEEDLRRIMAAGYLLLNRKIRLEVERA